MVPSSSAKKLVAKDLHLEKLPKSTREAFLTSSSFGFLRTSLWYLAGGTALALQVGHRQSVDLDFFIENKDFSESQIEHYLLKEGHWVTTLKQEGTIYGIFDGAKISFIAYPFFRPSAKFIKYGNIKIINPDDIAAMKVIAISQRGKKRDFIDLYWYCNFRGTLEDAIERAIAQYPDQKHSLPHFLKSLVYFEDAEKDPMPKLFFDADWKGIKAYFRSAVPVIAKKMLKLE